VLDSALARKFAGTASVPSLPLDALKAFLLPNVVMLTFFAWTGNKRPFILNSDYLALPLLFFLTRRMQSPLLVVAIASMVLAAMLSADLFTTYEEIFFAGPMMLIDYLPFVASWPWKSIMPLLLALSVVSVAIVALVMPRKGGNIGLGLAFAAALAAVVIKLISGWVFSQAHLPPGRLSLISSGFKVVLQPSLNQLRDRLAGEPATATRLSADTLFTDLTRGGPYPARILSVAVESWGLYVDSTERQRSYAVLVTGLSPRYRLSDAGSHPFYGATLAGEARELCGINLLGVPRGTAELSVFAQCLPQILRSRGYYTSAYHGNDSAFYNRSDIYPAIGFTEASFFGQLRTRVATPCNHLFVGICDRDVLALAVAGFGRQPHEFVHVMTLDSHFPLRGTVKACPQGSVNELCAYNELIGDTLQNLAIAIHSAGALPNLIVLYGDHAPPSLDPSVRALFDPHRVPYLVFELQEAPSTAANTPGSR
jgi:hypothetical protein